METSIWETVQKEAHIEETQQALLEHVSVEGKKDTITGQLTASETELEKVNREYWRLERKLQIETTTAPSNGLLRALNSYRAKFKWHLHHYLRDTCVARGGCCKRDCGCCERPRSDTREFRFGHCTAECTCCERDRGCELDSEERKIVEPNFSKGNNTSYENQMINAFFFGMEEAPGPRFLWMRLVWTPNLREQKI